MKKIVIMLVVFFVCGLVHAQDPEERVLRITDIMGIQGKYVVGGEVNVSNWLWNWNIDYVAGRRLLRQRMGYEALTGDGAGVPGGYVDGIFWFTPVDDDEALILVIAGKVYRYNSNLQIYGDWGRDEPFFDNLYGEKPDGGMYNGKMVLIDGDSAFYYNTTSFTISSGINDDIRHWSIWHTSVDRQWISGNRDSLDVLAYTWPNADSIQGSTRVGYNDGYEVTVISSGENYIYVHKPSGVWIITLHTTSYTDNQDNVIYAGTPVNISKSYAMCGAVSKNALCRTNIGDYYVGNDGVYLFQHGNTTKLSTAIDHYFTDSLDRCYMKNIVMTTWREKLFMSYPQAAADLGCGTGHNVRTLIYDIKTESWSAASFAARVFVADPSAEEDEFDSPDVSPGRNMLYWGNTSQTDTTNRFFVYGGLVDTTRTDNGSAFTSVWETGWWCGEEGANVKKNLLRFWLTAHTEQGSDIDLIIYENFSGTASHTQEYTLSPGWNQISGSITGSVQGEYFRFRATAQDSSGLVSIEEWNIGYTIAGEK